MRFGRLLGPSWSEIGSLTERIRDYDRQLEEISKEALPRNRAPATGRGGRAAHGADLRAHPGGSLPLRKEPQRGRLSGACASQGSVGRQRPSEAHLQGRRRDAQEAPGKRAHYVLGPFGSDSDLRRHGQKIASRGGKNAKKRAVVAVARKLAVLLHSLWVSAEVYEPLRNTQRSAGGQAA